MTDNNEEDEKKVEAAYSRYCAAAHAMQAGVGLFVEIQGQDGQASPKHLRVGVNSAMVEHGALVDLLVEKGIFTRVEYSERLADFMEMEAKSYEDKLSEHFGKKITLI